MNEVVEKLILTGIGTGFGYLLKVGVDHSVDRIWRLRTLRKFWSFLEEKTAVFIPNKPPSTGEWGPAMGYGDGLALAEIQILGKRLFPSMSQFQIVSDRNRFDAFRDSNLVIIGGGKHNAVYRQLVEELRPGIHFFDTDTEDFKEIRNASRSIVYSPEYKNGGITSDLGLILWCRRPSTQKIVLILAGSHTYGSWAAAQFLTVAKNVRPLIKYRTTGLELVVRCPISGNQVFPASPESALRRLGEGSGCNER